MGVCVGGWVGVWVCRERERDRQTLAGQGSHVWLKSLVAFDCSTFANYYVYLNLVMKWHSTDMTFAHYFYYDCV